MPALEHDDLSAFPVHGLQTERIPIELRRDVEVFHRHVRHCVFVAQHAFLPLTRLGLDSCDPPRLPQLR
jgi:hypothetical protein